MSNAGRPNEYDSLELAEKLKAYILTAYPFPILAEFTVSLGIPRTYIYSLAKNCKELSDAIELCHDNKEVKLQKGMAIGEIPPAFGNFALKQLGWKDTQEVNTNMNITGIKVQYE